jgi:nucleotide-binding universal stress UspA family protein
VPLDGSKRAETILPHVEEIARRFKAEVIFMQIPESNVITEINIPEFTRRIEEASAYLNAHRNQFHDKGIKAQTLVKLGPVVETIIDVAEREGIDLIAMASHGRGGLSRVFYGSVAAGVLQRVDRPLLLVRTRE